MPWIWSPTLDRMTPITRQALRRMRKPKPVKVSVHIVGSHRDPMSVPEDETTHDLYNPTRHHWGDPEFRRPQFRSL